MKKYYSINHCSDKKYDKIRAMSQVIKKLSEFGEGFKHHHENYQAYSISVIRETGGTWDFGGLVFHFPEHFGFCYGVDKAIDLVF